MTAAPARGTVDPRPRLDAPLSSRQCDARIFDRVLAACRRRPDAPAIVDTHRTWTYADLERASRALAHRLLDTHAEDDVVALYARRSGELVVGMLACLRAGLTFAVLDAAYPVGRIAQLLEVLRPGRFVAIDVGDEVLARLPLSPVVLRLAPAGFDALLRGEDREDDRLDRAPVDSIAYLLFTSGTTGVPKCIATSHAPLVHFVAWYVDAFAVDAHSRFSMLSGLGHDPVLRDVFVPLSVGAALHVPPQATVLDPTKLYPWIAANKITHAHVTPQLCRILCAGRRDQAPLPALRFVFSGGDKLRCKQANEVLAVAPGARVVNFYGATETPQAMGCHVFDPAVDGALDVVPIGRGIADVQLVVLDDTLAHANIGARGQIAIRTRFLSAGYRDDAALTHARFRPNPYAQDETDRLYLTGDVGSFRANGDVIIEGRLDDQLKIRGFRVELGDVVHQLERMDSVTEAVVLAEQAPDQESRLVAYLVGRSDALGDAAATAAVRDAMTAAAPAYMVPARFVWVPRVPLLPNGKIDRPALRALEPSEGIGTAEPLDATTAQIVAHWRALLGRSAIDPESSFVDLGGDSLSFIEASVQLETLLGALPDGWERRSIRELAGEKRDHRSRWTRSDASVLVRAISIVAVVAGHLDLPNLDGSVRALFVVSGMSFGRYLVPQVLATARATPILRLLLRVAVPTVLYTMVVNLVYRLPQWPGLLLVNNLVDPDSHRSGIGFWFIDVLVQSLLVLAALVSLGPVRRTIARDAFRVALAATIAFDAIAWLAPYVWDTSALFDRVPQEHLGAVCLGWMVVYADSPSRKLLVAAAAVLTFWPALWESLVVFPPLITIFLVFVARVPLPRLLGRLVTVVASASLFIYLIDHQVAWAFEKVRLGDHVFVILIVAVVGGIVVRYGWERAVAVVTRRSAPTIDAS